VQIARTHVLAVRAESESWKRLVDTNLVTLGNDLASLVRLGLKPDPRSVELFARRLARKWPAIADVIRPLLPPVNPCRGGETP
jgi:hypothetical protein